MKSLPLVTMEKIGEVNRQRGKQYFIQQTYEQMKTSHTIKSSLSVVSGIALRKKKFLF